MAQIFVRDVNNWERGVVQKSLAEITPMLDADRKDEEEYEIYVVKDGVIKNGFEKDEKRLNDRNSCVATECHTNICSGPTLSTLDGEEIYGYSEEEGCPEYDGMEDALKEAIRMVDGGLLGPAMRG